MADKQTLIANAYAAFNRRDVDGALALMTDTVRWPKASEGGHVVGKEEIRAYWTRQWAEFDPHVEPLEIIEDTRRQTHVRVHQLVKSLQGDVLSDTEVWHIYTITNGLIDCMDLKDAPPLHPRPSESISLLGQPSVADRQLASCMRWAAYRVVRRYGVAPKVRSSGSQIAGTGLFASEDLSAGEIVLIIDDSWTVDANHSVPENEEIHCDYLGGGKVVLMQPPERYINHSCTPNVFFRTREDVREAVALRSIQAGEEIAFDYSINGFGDTIWTCTCQSSRCRRSVHSNFFHLPVRLQKEYLPLLDDWFRVEHAEQIKALEAARLPD